ncbi:MAG TPA: hypothetical protein VGG64_02975, partial [Pirellulales bacterium]
RRDFEEINMRSWVINNELARLVYTPENYAIDLRRLAHKDDVRAVIKDLKREPFATAEVVEEAQRMLNDFLVWVIAQDRVTRVR